MMEKTKRKSLLYGSRSVLKAKPKQYYDYSLLAVIILLTCFGLIMLYSTSAYMAQMSYNDDMYFFKKQAVVSGLCILVAIVISRLDYHILKFFVLPLYFGSLFLMALVKTPLGYESHGARRWLRIGSLTLQPAEIAKIAVIIAVSFAIVRFGKNVATAKGVTILLLIGFLQAAAAYKFTENLSTAIIIFGITAGLVFIAHPRYRGFVIALILGSVVMAFLVNYMNATMQTSEQFRIRRILVWLHPEDYASGDGYQTLQALYAIGSGGFFGRGLGNSIQKLGSVPEAQNDFIFSIICEELGIFGGMIVLLFFGYLLYRLFFIAQNAPDMVGSLLVSGIFIHISLQVVLNIAVVVNLLPNTGVTLPFVSYGGTSILFLMAEMGLALSVARQIELRKTLPENLL